MGWYICYEGEVNFKLLFEFFHTNPINLIKNLGGDL